MRIEFLRNLIQTGFLECVQCGKMTPSEMVDKGLCPQCNEPQ